VAEPQLENGHTRIANEILEQLMRMHLSPNQWQVLLCIFRKTYGFHKKVDYIANIQIIKATGLGKEVVSRALKALSDMNLIERQGKHIGFQKDWEKWQRLAEQSSNVSSIANKEHGKVSNIVNQKLAISSTEVSSTANKKLAAHTSHKRKKDTIQKILHKRKGEFQNVLLTDEEYQKLIDKFGEVGTKEKIEVLSSGIASKGYKYKNHYATILSWDRRDKRQGGQGGEGKNGARRSIETHRRDNQGASTERLRRSIGEPLA